MSRKAALILVSVVSLVFGYALSQYGPKLFANPGVIVPGPASEPDSGSRPGGDLAQASDSLVAAALDSVPKAKSDEMAINRISVTSEALRLIGLLGDREADVKNDRLLDELQKSARGNVVDAIVQIRTSKKLRQWPSLANSDRARVIDRFIADMKQVGPKPAHVDFVIQLTDVLTDRGADDFVYRVATELQPTYAAANDPAMKRVAPMLEGIARRATIVGKPIDLEGTLLGGGKLDWSAYRGKVVLVDYFASFCGPCRAELPNVLENYLAYRDKGFEVVTVNLDPSREDAEMYIAETRLPFPVLFNDDVNAMGWEHPMGRKYGVTRLPQVFLVDQNGVVVDKDARGEVLGMQLRKLLGEPSDAGTRSTQDTSLRSAPVIRVSGEENAEAAPPPIEPGL
jgi:thiol-disulfide isomerase/thioredoxin